MFSTDPVQKDEINRKAFEKFKKEHASVAPTIDNAVPSERFDGECICMKTHQDPVSKDSSRSVF